MKIVRCNKNDKNCRLIRRNHLIFPDGNHIDPNSTNAKRVRIFHSVSTKHSDKQEILLTNNENSLSKILYLNTTEEPKRDEKSKLSTSIKEKSIDYENNNEIIENNSFYLFFMIFYVISNSLYNFTK